VPPRVGPFKLKQYLPGTLVEMERNADYFVPGRPYLDGIRYPIITERGTRLAALQTGRLDVSMPLEMTKTMADTLKQAVPSLVVTVVGQNGSDNVVVNHKRAPFDTLAVRRAVSLAMDRHAYVKGVRHNGALVGAALMPPPQGTWGLSERICARCPATEIRSVTRARPASGSPRPASGRASRSVSSWSRATSRSTSISPRSWPTSSGRSASRRP
jgi:peptide/nickel transport system substrate-binding protein